MKKLPSQFRECGSTRNLARACDKNRRDRETWTSRGLGYREPGATRSIKR
jgi:hypothetical protein